MQAGWSVSSTAAPQAAAAKPGSATPHPISTTFFPRSPFAPKLQAMCRARMYAESQITAPAPMAATPSLVCSVARRGWRKLADGGGAYRGAGVLTEARQGVLV